MKPWVLPVVFLLVVCFGIGLIVVESPKKPGSAAQSVVTNTNQDGEARAPKKEQAVPESEAIEASQDDEEILRRSREREEAERWFSKLEVQFGMLGLASGPGSSGPGSVTQEVTLTPGHEIMPRVSVKNKGSEPIEGLRFALKNDDDCLECVMPDWHAFGLDERDLKAKEESNRRFNQVLAKVHADLFGRGVPICVGDVSVKGGYSTTINPYGVYSSDVGAFCGHALLDQPFTRVTGVGAWPPEWEANLNGQLIVKRNLAGGQDKRFSGYLVYNGQRRHIGTVTIHVAYR